MTLVRDLLTALPTRGGGSPLLTWYGADGERVDLSARVLGTWVAKTVDLLVEEADAGPGTRVALDLPVHWRTLVWALATWTAGAEVLPLRTPIPSSPSGRPPSSADVVVTADPGTAGGTGAVVVAVPLPALALRWPGALPAGVLDGAADLLGRPDALGWLPPTDPGAPALLDVAHADLLAHARAHSGAASWPDAPRVLLGATTTLPDVLPDVLLAALAVWAAAGSVVLRGPGAPSPEHVAVVERVTAGL